MIVVVCYKHVDGTYRYSRYDGRRCTHGFIFELPLSPHWVEEIRNAPQQFDEPPQAA